MLSINQCINMYIQYSYRHCSRNHKSNYKSIEQFDFVRSQRMRGAGRGSARATFSADHGMGNPIISSMNNLNFNINGRHVLGDFISNLKFLRF